MSRLSDYYPAEGDAESQWRTRNKGVIAGGEDFFVDLIEILRVLGCISRQTFVDASFDEDYMSENYN